MTTPFMAIAIASASLSDRIGALQDAGAPIADIHNLLRSWDLLRRSLAFLPAADEAERKIHQRLIEEFPEDANDYVNELFALGVGGSGESLQ